MNEYNKIETVSQIQRYKVEVTGGKVRGEDQDSGMRLRGKNYYIK